MPADETRVFVTLLVVLSMVTLFLVFFITTIVSYHKKHLRLYMRQVAAEMQTLENERKRIATNLHDDIGPVLSIIKLQISSKVEDAADVLLEEAIQNVDYVVQHIRQLNDELLPAVLLRKGLTAALHATAEQVNRSGDLYVGVRIDCDTSILNEYLSMQLYRIVQELLNNTLKHGGASRFDVGLVQLGKYLHVHVRDDGKGFDLDEVMKNSIGFGVRNIISRTELLGGELRIETSPGAGSKYLLKLPFTYGQEKYTHFTGRRS